MPAHGFDLAYNGEKGGYHMRTKLTAVLMAFFLLLSLSAGMTPAFAAGTTRAQAKAQANAYHKHSLGLTSVENARDLGGYTTKDGRRVKFGKLLRTGDLTNLSDRDANKLLKTCHVKKVVDFRSYRNILMDGQDRELAGVEYSHYPYSSMVNFFFSEAGFDLTKDIVTDLVQRDFNGRLIREYFNEGYKAMYLTEDGIRMFRGFFDELLDAKGDTVLFHCVHGKDRTGNATMLLLSALGVDKETIIADFMLTNDYYVPERQENYDRAYKLTKSKTIAKDMSYLDGVSREWIENSYDTIETHYGSVNNFLKNTIGLSEKDIQKLQKAYLE